MRRLFATLFLITALALPGLISTGVTSYADEAEKPLIKCSTCGTVFTAQAGLTDHLKVHPDHRAASPIIKCSTCGTEFTTIKETDEHLKNHQNHKIAPME